VGAIPKENHSKNEETWNPTELSVIVLELKNRLSTTNNPGFNNMQEKELNELLNKGKEAIEKGYIPSAQVFFSQVAEQKNSPEVRSYMAYCLAKSQGRTQVAAKTCIESIRREPDNPTHYLLLGRIHLLNNDKIKAVKVLRQGANINKDQRIINEISKLGLRKAPVIKSLKRNHPVNRILGKIFARLGLR